MRGLARHPSGPLPPVDVLDAARVDARRLRRPPPLAASHHHWVLTTGCSPPPRWLRPWRHAGPQHLAQRPDVLRQSSGHGGRLRLPRRGRAAAVGGLGLRQGLTETGVRHAQVVGRLRERQRLSHPSLALAPRADPSSDRRPMLAHRQGDALNARCMALPAAGRSPLVDGLEGAQHDPMPHADQAPHGLDPRRLEQRGQRPPARRGGRAGSLTVRELHPWPIVGAPGRQGRPDPIGEAPRGAVGGQPLHHLMDHTWGQGQRALAHVHRQPHLALGVHGPPDPLRRPLQTRERLGLTALAGLDRAAPGKACVPLPLSHPPVVPDVARKGVALRRCLPQPLQHRSRVDRAPPRRAPDASALGSARADAHNELGRRTLPVQERPKGLENGVTTAPTPPLPPGTAMGMAMGAERAPAHPTTLGPVRVGAAMRGGVDLAASPPCGHEAWWRGTGCRRVEGAGVLTGVAGRLLREARTGYARTVARGHWGCGVRCRRAHGGGGAGPRPLEQEAPPHQGDQHPLGDKESRDHGKTPSYRC
jgi:hypothetical protein